MTNEQKNLKKGLKKFESLITTIIVGGAIASIFGASKTKKGKKWKQIFKKIFGLTGKIVLSVVKFLTKK